MYDRGGGGGGGGGGLCSDEAPYAGGRGAILAFTDLRVFVVVHSRRIAVFLICYIFIDFSPQGFLRSPSSSLLS